MQQRHAQAGRREVKHGVSFDWEQPLRISMRRRKALRIAGSFQSEQSLLHSVRFRG